MNILSYTYAFKYKRFSGGHVKKSKSRFCAIGGEKIERVDYFETYAPVVIWTTILLMIILECLLYLKSKYGDVNCTFLYSHLTEYETLYDHMTQVFNQYDKKRKAKVLKINRCTYGLKNNPQGILKVHGQQN